MTRETLIGTSSATRQLALDIDDATRSDAKVLLTGESGVGKEVAARLIHEGSRRRAVRLVAINCAAVPDTLLESELFGHVRGSFTGAYRDKPGLFELAANGTIFLDEIGETSLRMQALMLRFVENGEIWRIGASMAQPPVDVRIIAATNRELAERIDQKEFRADLYYRLNVLHVRVPPLRERREDIPAFLDHFLRHFAERHLSPVPELTGAARAMLAAYDWPGNIRELKNVVERLVVQRRAAPIGHADLPDELRGVTTGGHLPDPRGGARRERADELYDRMVIGGESFWSAVHPLFMARDMTREDLRAIISRALTQTRGSYRLVLQLFNMPPQDYKTFLTFLTKHQCKMPFLPFRCTPVGGEQVSDDVITPAPSPLRLVRGRA